MDIQKIIAEAVKALTENEALLKAFNENPAKTLESKLGIDLPDDIMEKIVEGVKGKITLDKAKDALEGLKKLF